MSRILPMIAELGKVLPAAPRGGSGLEPERDARLARGPARGEERRHRAHDAAVSNVKRKAGKNPRAAARARRATRRSATPDHAPRAERKAKPPAPAGAQGTRVSRCRLRACRPGEARSPAGGSVRAAARAHRPRRCAPAGADRPAPARTSSAAPRGARSGGGERRVALRARAAASGSCRLPLHVRHRGRRGAVAALLASCRPRASRASRRARGLSRRGGARGKDLPNSAIIGKMRDMTRPSRPPPPVRRARPSAW